MGYVWDFQVVFQALPVLLKGLLYTILIAFASMTVSLPLGIGLSLIRLSPVSTLRAAAKIYIDFFRCTPILMQVFWFYYSLPVIFKITLSSMQTGLIALSLNLTAYIAETVRAGIQSVPPGQREAACAIGMTTAQSLRRVILPQAIRKIIPPLGSTWVSLFKDTSLLSTIVVPEMMYQANILSNTTFRPVEVYTVVAVIYFVVTFPQSRYVDNLYEKSRVRT